MIAHGPSCTCVCSVETECINFDETEARLSIPPPLPLPSHAIYNELIETGCGVSTRYPAGHGV